MMLFSSPEVDICFSVLISFVFITAPFYARPKRKPQSNIHGCEHFKWNHKVRLNM